MEIKYPLELGVLVTTLCNFQCVHCSSVQPTMPLTHMPPEMVFDIIEEAEELGVLNINITGGEPFLHPNIWEILKRILDGEMQLHLNSNFSIPDKRQIEDLATLLYGGHLDVTVHASKTNFYKFTGAPSRIYIKVIENITNAYDLGIDVGVAITVNNMNKSSLTEIIMDIRGISDEIPIVITLTHPTGRALKNWDKLEFNEREVEKLIVNSGFKNILLQRHYPTYNFTPEYLKKVKLSGIETTGCPCGTFSMFIWPDGRCTWCPYSVEKPFLMGMFRGKGDLLKVWKRRQPDGVKVNRDLSIECRGCPFHFVCRGGCPIDAKNLTGSIYKRDPFCVKYLGDLPWKYHL